MARTLELAGMDLDEYGDRLQRIPLLTRDEELALATLVQRGKVARGYLEVLVSDNELFDAARGYIDGEAMAGDAHAGDEAKLRLVFHNLRFAFWAALVSMNRNTPRRPIRVVRRRFWWEEGEDEDDQWGGRQIESLRRFAYDRLPLADRVQEANLALFASADAYYPHEAAKFVSYVGKAIYNAIVRAVLCERYGDGLSRRKAESMAATIGAAARLRRQTGSEPTPEMIAADSGQGAKAVGFRLEEWSVLPESLEKRLGELNLVDETTGEVRHPGDLVWEQGAPSGEDFAFALGRFEAIEAALAKIPKREAAVIRFRFGLVDGQTHTLREAGREFGVSFERIRQVESKALSLLRHPNRAMELRDYLDDPSDWQWFGVSEQGPERVAPRRVIDVWTHPGRYDFKVHPELMELVRQRRM